MSMNPSVRPSAPPPSEIIGKVVRERYKVLRLLGEGGMGGVYEAEHTEIGRRVAIKFVSTMHARNPDIAARLKREARSTGALESEYIVQVFDAGEDPELGLYLVMEVLRGKDLGSILEANKRIGPVEAAQIIFQAALGLEKAHVAGIVHRDLKPPNIFVVEREDGRAHVKLVDFGIAKLVRDAERAATMPGLTRAGTVIGTPQYMSPEQAQGLDSLDHRTDVYSLGAVLFEMLSGDTPYPLMPTYEQTILAIVTKPAPRLSSVMPGVNRALDDLIAAMLSQDPAARPPDMRAVRNALVAIFPEVDSRKLTMEAVNAGVGETVVGAPSARNIQLPGSQVPQPQLPPMRPPVASAPGTMMMPSSAGSGPGPAVAAATQPSAQAPSGSGPMMQPMIPGRTSGGVAMERGAPASRGPNVAVIVAGAALVFALLVVVGAVVFLKRSAATDRQQAEAARASAVASAVALASAQAASASLSASPSASASASAIASASVPPASAPSSAGSASSPAASSTVAAVVKQPNRPPTQAAPPSSKPTQQQQQQHGVIGGAGVQGTF